MSLWCGLPRLDYSWTRPVKHHALHDLVWANFVFLGDRLRFHVDIAVVMSVGASGPAVT